MGGSKENAVNMAKKLKDLLVGQKLTFDNHHPNVEAKWDNNLHFHKSMTIEDHGKKAKVSGIFYVANPRQVDVKWDLGNNNHRNVRNDKQATSLQNSLKKEISDALKNDDQAHAFLDNIWTHLKSINAGVNPKELKSRYCEAYDNIMNALGISNERKIEIRNQNKNKGYFSLYVDSIDQFNDYQSHVKRVVMQYNSWNNDTVIERNPPIYFICYMDNELAMGELTPSQTSLFRHKGFRLSGVGIDEALKGYND